MKAVILEPDRAPRLEQVPIPTAPPGEALVRVLRAGVCDTDLQLARGYLGFRGVPGHEFVGTVEAAEGAPDLVGATVVGEINAACGRCEWCRGGLSRHCPTRTVLGIQGRPGAFAEYLTLPLGNLLRVPSSLPLERAVFIEPVAAAWEILEQVPVAGRRCLVVGAGKLGGLCARVLRLGGAEVGVVARHRESLELLAADGFEALLPAEATAGPRVDLVVEATGSPDGLPLALALVRPRGTLVLKTTVAGALNLDLAPVVIDEISVIGSRCGPFAPALAALARGEITPEETIGGRYALEDAAAAFAAAASPADPGRRKIVFTLD